MKRRMCQVMIHEAAGRFLVWHRLFYPGLSAQFQAEISQIVAVRLQ